MAFPCIINNVKHALRATQTNLFESQVAQSQGDMI